VGELLAEGGEGRVFELPLQPHLVYKAYRKAQPSAGLEDLVDWPSTAVAAPSVASRLAASAAWPTAVVLGPEGLAAGLLLPRAPRRFALRHRDGAMRLSSLSYLTADPGHRAAAYGLDLPSPASEARLGIIYALARLLEAFEAGRPRIGHGDLSTKNVLWSLQRGPEVFVIDCDNCERFDVEGIPLGVEGRRRAMTPNWDDPAVKARDNPSAWTDRYSLALIFLRVVGAANFPMQARQREGAAVSVDFPVPRGSFAHEALGPQSPVWKLCESGLGIARPDLRPPPGLWVTALEEVLVAGGAAKIVQAAQALQGDEPGVRIAPTAQAATPRHFNGDVSINPVVREAEPRKWERKGASGHTAVPWLRPFAVAGAPVLVSSTAQPVAGPGLSRGWPSAPRPLGNPGKGVWRQVRAYLRAFLAWWAEAHTRAASLLLRRGQRRDGLRAAAFCSVVDLVLFVIGLFLVGMIVAPIIGI
jgi:hypothetical protein